MQSTTVTNHADGRDLERLHDAELHLAGALAAARETITRCELALYSLAEARMYIAHNDEPRAAAPGQRHRRATPNETGYDDYRISHNGSLTAREVEVLRLIAASLSNRQIADILFISPRTIERHIANIYLKIDAHSKAEATAYARRHDLA